MYSDSIEENRQSKSDHSGGRRRESSPSWSHDRCRSRSRDRRSRSRGRSRSRSRDRRRRYRSEHEERERHRSRHDRDGGGSRRRRDDEDWGRGRTERRGFISSPVIFLENVPSGTVQSDILAQLENVASKIRDVRVFRRGDKGEHSFLSAVIEFYEKVDAVLWLAENKDGFTVNGAIVAVETRNESSADNDSPWKGDWICFRCHKLNFTRRTNCISCRLSRRDSEIASEREDYSGSNSSPSSVLILRGLEDGANELKVIEAVTEFSPGLRLQDVRLIRDKFNKKSRGFCFLDLGTVEEATALLEKLTSKNSLYICGRRVTVDYARSSQSWSNHQAPANSVASAAIAAGQWAHVDPSVAAAIERTSAKKPGLQASQASSSSNNGLPTPQQSTTDLPANYSYDESSGFYYDSNTGLYFDPKTQYHFNSQTGQYCYYDSKLLKYIPVDSSGNPVPEASAEEAGKKKKEPSSLVTASSVNAKKIAKNMERWAKSVNVAKKAQKQSVSQQEKQEAPVSFTKPSSLTKIPSVGIAVGHTVQDQSVTQKAESHSPSPAPNVNDTHTDWEQIACLLCKRKFPTKESLIKHQQLSDLHKKNLESFTKSVQSTKSIQPKYRDRAQERRTLVGTTAPEPRRARDTDYEPQVPSYYEQPTVHGLGQDNIGSKMLTAMGWNDGQGLGKSNQGIVEPIKAQMRTGQAGLGAVGSTYYGEGDNYRKNLMAMTQARFNDTQ